jgi:hypothetical protein
MVDAEMMAGETIIVTPTNLANVEEMITIKVTDRGGYSDLS